MPFCTGCGNKLNDGAKFCPNCGQKNEVSAPKIQEITPQQPVSKPAPQTVVGKEVEERTIDVATTTAPKQSFTKNVTIKTCHGCGKPFELSTAKVIFGHHYHNECTKCHLCGAKIFSFSKFYEDDGEILCHPCMLKSVPKCSGCGKPLVGDFVSAGGRNWHKQCVPDNL
ncbi:LIM zinc-binding domain-containing protein [Entamoeba marina]